MDSRVYVGLQRIILVQMEAPMSMWFYKESSWNKQGIHDLCGSTRIMLVHIETPWPMYLYQESYLNKWRLQCLCGSAQNYTGTNGGPSAQAILQRIILVQMRSQWSMWYYILVQLEIPGSMWFWYKQNHRGLGYSTKNPTGTNESSSVYVVPQ